MFWGNRAVTCLSPCSDRCYVPRCVPPFSLSPPLPSHSSSTAGSETARGSRGAENGAHDHGCEQFRRSKVANGGSDCPNLPFPRGLSNHHDRRSIQSLNRLLSETSCPEIPQTGLESRCRRNVAAAPSTRGSLASQRSCQSNHGPPSLGSARDDNDCGGDGELSKTPGGVWNIRSKRNEQLYHRLP